ncbi:MAG: hypothetical protein A2V70_08285 [Planctomycetes bacterium RBG_13_63_9]|nr:MAG: hypothetical protein A2V70_08285 [Planctomycetes bacterium RBG_13_63_9]
MTILVQNGVSANSYWGPVGQESSNRLYAQEKGMDRKVSVTREEALVTVVLVLTGLVLLICR